MALTELETRGSKVSYCCEGVQVQEAGVGLWASASSKFRCQQLGGSGMQGPATGSTVSGTNCWRDQRCTDVFPTAPYRAGNRMKQSALFVCIPPGKNVQPRCLLHLAAAASLGSQNQHPPTGYSLLSSLYISSKANSNSFCHSSFISMRLYPGTKSWGGICATICLLRIRSILCICSSSFSSLSLSFK